MLRQLSQQTSVHLICSCHGSDAGKMKNILIILTIAAPQEVREQCQSLRVKEAKNH